MTSSEADECRKIAESLGWTVLQTESSHEASSGEQFAPWKSHFCGPAVTSPATPADLLAFGSSKLAEGTQAFKSGRVAQAWLDYGHAIGALREAQRINVLTSPSACELVRACSNYALCSLKLELPREAVTGAQFALADDALLEAVVSQGLFGKLAYRCAQGMQACGDGAGAIDVLSACGDLGVQTPETESLLRRLKSL